MKVALFFDVFTERGGAENVAIMLAKKLKLDIYTTYVDWDNVDKELKKLNVNEIGLSLKNAKLLTYTEILSKFLQIKVENYDAYLFLRVYSFPAAYNHHPNIWISSGILDLAYHYFKNKLPFHQRAIYSAWFHVYRFLTKEWIKNFDSILANSTFTKKTIKKFYNVDSLVAYHPIEAKKFRCRKFDDFYLVPTRLTLDKRVDIIIDAFKHMPEKKLLIAGDGPEREKLERLAKNHRNIHFLGSLNIDKLIKLYSTCTAAISLGAIESLGLIPLESMASGKPCIASNSGGHRETIIHGKTGYLIKPNAKEIIKHTHMLTPEKAESMKKACQERARQFDIDIFIKTVKKEIKKVIEENKTKNL